MQVKKTIPKKVCFSVPKKVCNKIPVQFLKHVPKTVSKKVEDRNLHINRSFQ